MVPLVSGVVYLKRSVAPRDGCVHTSYAQSEVAIVDTPSDAPLSAVLHKVNDNIVLVGPARNRLQTGAAFASACSLVLLCALCTPFIRFSDSMRDPGMSDLSMFGIATFLLVIVLTQFLYRRSFLFQKAPAYAVFDRKEQLGYWASDGHLRPVAWKKIRFFTVETSRRLNTGQWLHQHFLRVESAEPGERSSVEIPIAQTLDTLSGTKSASQVDAALSRFMDGSAAIGVGIVDLREQSHKGLLQSIASWVVPSQQSIKAHPWSFLFGVLSLPVVVPFFVINAFYMAAVSATSTPVRWPDELVSGIGATPTGSQLQAIISSKL